MTDVAALIADMVRAGVDPDLIGRAAAALAEREPVIVQKRSAGAIRQERYRNKRNEASLVTDGDAPSPKESPQTPKETPPSTPKETPLRGSKKGTRLPSDFAPDLAFATAEGLSLSSAQTEAAKFADYWLAQPGQRGTKLDWDATWRNWVRTSLQRAAPPQQRARPFGAKPKTAADFLMAETMDGLNGFGPQTSNWPDAGEFSGVTVPGTARRLSLPDGR